MGHCFGSLDQHKEHRRKELGNRMEMPEPCSACKASPASGREGGHTCPFIQPTLHSRYSVPSTVCSVLFVLHLGTEAALVGHPNAQGSKPHPCPLPPAPGKRACSCLLRPTLGGTGTSFDPNWRQASSFGPGIRDC